jgi:putative drug exporter of the RND superfamily
MKSFAEFMIRHRRWVMLVWLLIFMVGGATAGTATERLSTDFSLPGQVGYETSQQIAVHYAGSASGSPYIPVATVPAGSTVEQKLPEINAVFAQIQKALPEARIANFQNTQDTVFLTSDNQTTYGLLYGPPPSGFAPTGVLEKVKPILATATAETGITWGLTGYDLLAIGDSSSTGKPPNIMSEVLLGAAGALIVLLFVFASLMAFLPLIIAAVSILSTFLVVLGVSYLTDVSFIVQFLIGLVGLGVAIDYSLLIVTRWREERDNGLENRDAVLESMRTAGHAVISSALTVAISLIALLVIPVPFLRSVGIGGMLIPLVSTAVVLTLLPAILSSVGPRIDWPKIRHEQTASKGWSTWARMIVNHKWPAAILATVILGLLIAPVFDIKIGVSQTDSLSASGPAFDAFEKLKAGGVPTGIVSPMQVLVEGASPQASATEVVTKSSTVEGVSTAYSPDLPQWRKGDTALVDVIPTEETVDSTNATVVTRVTDAVKDVPGFVGVAGAGATVIDYMNAVYTNFPFVLLLVTSVTFVLLARAFRSLLLAFKAVTLNLISVAATFGVTVWLWQQGHGSEAIFGISATGAITFWLPVMIFAFLFGLSMDYEVFILSRMREEYDRTGSTRQAIIEGLGRTGRLVTCAALILFLAFTALASSPGTDIKVFATALGIGILLDATVVRALLVPALVALFGRWNWWLPPWAAKVLFTEPHAAVPEVDEDVDRPSESVPAPV